MAKHRKSKKKQPSGKKKFDLLKSVNDFWTARSTAFRFSGIFLLCMMLFYVFYYSTFYIANIHPVIVNTQAKIGSFLISMFGHSTETVGSIINGNGFSLDISAGCDGIEVTAILVAGILAFPAFWSSRAMGIVVGVLIISALNLLRLPALFFTGLNGSMNLFDFLHIQGGFVVFVVISIIIWYIWAVWAMNKEKQAILIKE